MGLTVPAVPERLRWAVQVVDPQPAEEILEIGCGPGVAAALVCERLETGRLLAVDRSQVAVERTTRRNDAQVAAGRLTVRECTLAALAVPPGTFDKAFSVNVNLFWTSRPRRELAVLRRALRPGGILYVLYGAAGPTAAERVTSAVSAALRADGFRSVATVDGEAGTGVSARAPGPVDGALPGREHPD
jgi:SAM-dependent methyltransferase